MVPSEVCGARRDRPRRIRSQEGPEESDHRCREGEWGAGGWEQGSTGQSPVLADNHVLGTDGGDSAQQCECADAPRLCT